MNFDAGSFSGWMSALPPSLPPSSPSLPSLKAPSPFPRMHGDFLRTISHHPAYSLLAPSMALFIGLLEILPQQNRRARYSFYQGFLPFSSAVRHHFALRGWSCDCDRKEEIVCEKSSFDPASRLSHRVRSRCRFPSRSLEERRD